MILGWRRPGKVGWRLLCVYSSLAQSVEHAAVNRRVVCSSQTGGAKEAAAWESAAADLFSGVKWAFSSVG